MRFYQATKQIKITRGDSGRARVAFKPDHVLYEMEEGDQINFGVKKDYEDQACVITKTYTTNPFVLALDPADTKQLPFGDYVYDMQIVKADGYTKTFLKEKVFTVTREVV